MIEAAKHRARRGAYAGSAAFVALLILFPQQSIAGCTDAAGPGVDWKGCKLNDQVFTDLDMTGARLRDGRYFGTDFSNTNLAKSDNRSAKFIGAILRGTNLEGARLIRADFTKADLTGANLKDADLRRAKLYRSVLRDVDLTGARLGGADLLDADLSGATWTDGKTICDGGSIGRCTRRPAGKSKTSS